MRALVIVAVALLATLLPVDPAHGLVLDPPVIAPVLRGFDAPTPYGPGHRGVDLGAPPGTRVRASAAGLVTFAGHVVGNLWVTVDHGVLRTTVGPLATTAVRRGDRVRRGSVLGTSGHAHGRAGVHWSARRDDTYVDPSTAGRVVASLVPARAARAHRPTWPDRRVR